MRARVKPGRRRGGKALAKTLNPRTLVAAQAIDRPRARSAGRDHRAGMLRAGAATALSVVLVALVCFLAGLLARTVPAQHIVNALESSVLSKIPAYEYLKRGPHALWTMAASASQALRTASIDSLPQSV